MSDATRPVHRFGTFAILSAIAVAAPAAFADDHILISEVCANSLAGGEFIELYNPLPTTVDLSNYYLADNPLYARTPSAQHPQPAGGDFIARFPAGASIAPGAVVVVALSSGFFSAYGVNPTYEMPPGEGDPDGPAPNMGPAYLGSIAAGPDITNTGEGVILFFWDGQTDLVSDVDIVRVGQPDVNNNLVSKSGLSVDGPDADSIASTYHNETITMPTMTLNAGNGFSYKRRFLEGLNEQACGGNGINGSHEVTENIAINWDGSRGHTFSAPTPGSAPVFTNPPGQCFADITGNSAVDVNDLLAVITNWGPCGSCGNCASDITPATCHDCSVNVNDLLAVITNWGPCP